MKLSKLQKYILERSYEEKNKFSRAKLLKFYDNYKKPPLKEDQINIITKCLERLINQKLLTGYGFRRARKWFIEEIKLTGKGRKLARKLLSNQQTLPLKRKRRKQKLTINNK